MPKPKVVKAKPKVKPLAIDKEDLGEALHVALRKACDSTPTSLLWNLIYKIDAGVWEAYLDHVWLKLQVASQTSGDYWSVLKHASIEFDDIVHTIRSRDREKIDYNSVHLLDITFGLMTDDDWHGYASYLTE